MDENTTDISEFSLKSTGKYSESVSVQRYFNHGYIFPFFVAFSHTSRQAQRVFKELSTLIVEYGSAFSGET